MTSRKLAEAGVGCVTQAAGGWDRANKEGNGQVRWIWSTYQIDACT